jgi:lysophospholipase L1-like esterase
MQAPRKITVFMVGDSTMADKPNPEQNPERGWGQLLPKFFDDGVVVRNFAVNGRSTKSFIDEGRWEAIVRELSTGDYVLVQFGHNDEKQEDPARYTNAYTGYRRNLERFVTETRARGATPVLLSPIVRRHFNEHGTLEDTHGAYALVARLVARDLDVRFIDMQLMSEDLVAAAGVDSSKALYVWVAPGESPMYPEGRQDDTHLSVRGATELARLAARALRGSGLPLGRHVRGID